ncbi:unnamed protein product, partial [marine sediment metagenome]
MNTKEKAKWLSDYYAQVADGGEMEICHSEEDGWRGARNGPDMLTPMERYRIKPKPQIVDMGICIKSRIDCEFSDGGELWYTAKLTEVLPNGYRCTPTNMYYSYCRPRMSPHIHYWGGGVCPLPEGVIVRTYRKSTI